MKRIKHVISIMAIVVFLTIIIGCAANGPLLKPNQDSRREYVNTHPQLSQEIKQAILEGKVIKGMTKEDVKASWGEPTYIDNYSDVKEYDEVWSYKGLLFSLVEPSKYVTFKKGEATDIHIAEN